MVDRLDAAMERIASSTAMIQDGVEGIETSTSMLSERIGDMDSAVSGFADCLAGASSRISLAVDKSDSMIARAAVSGAEIKDAPMIRAVVALAAKISGALEEEIDQGRVDIDDLFDRDYRPIAGTDPQQFSTRALATTDRVLPQFQEPVVEACDRIVFCACVDTNGYLPTHNARFSQPQSDDRAWNMANCRNRRMFDDRVGLRAGRNTEPYLLQTYRREMGAGEFTLMKDVSAPITIKGRHWGGLRLAYKP